MSPRIAHVISTRGIGGAERFLAALVRSGNDRGWEQIVLNPFASEQSAPMASLCAPVPYVPRRCDRLVEVPWLRRWLRIQLEQFRPDIVHVLLFQALVVTASLPRRPGTGWLLTHAYGDWTQTSPHGRLTRELDRWAGRRFGRVVAISESVQQFLVSDYGYPASNVVCIPLGWQGEPRPHRTGDRPPTIACVAALRPEKGHDVLLNALPLVRRDVPDARLVLIGEGDCRPALEAQAAALGLGDSVEFLGSVGEIWSHLAEADVFALASRSEAFGIAIAEAMAAGLPVVASDAGAVPELVVPGVTGELFPPGDHEALARRLVRILTSPELRSEMSSAALAAAEPLRMENAVERYFGVYDELLKTSA